MTTNSLILPPDATHLRVDKRGDVVIDLHIIPNAPHTAIDGLHDGALRVRLKAPPVDGKANDALIAWLAKQLGVPRAALTLVQGQAAKRKRVSVQAQDAAAARWSALMP